MIRVVIVDDHHLVRQGIRALLEREADIQVVGEAESGAEVVKLVESSRPDVVVMDISMPRMDGTLATEQLHTLYPQTPVVILSMYSDEALVRRALQIGARGYLLKRSVTEELLLAIRAAARGELYLSPAISSSVVADFLTQPQEADPFDRLSPREREALKLIAEGYTNTAVAQAMNISVKTVEKHRASLMDKLNVHDLAGLIRAAIKHGLVFLDE
ncbi:MAG: response regulator transcription factor [Thermoflexales bacterium]|nr:response regulator transcription factor [Thermoflexales bacterium]